MAAVRIILPDEQIAAAVRDALAEDTDDGRPAVGRRQVSERSLVNLLTKIQAWLEAAPVSLVEVEVADKLYRLSAGAGWEAHPDGDREIRPEA